MSNIARERRASDYRELMSMQGPMLKVRPISGRAPYIDEYELTIFVRSIVGPEPTYRSIHVVRLTAPAGYPTQENLRAVMITKPYPFHPNWFKSGAWCCGASTFAGEGAGAYVKRLMQTLQFDPHGINLSSIANMDSARWYREKKNVKGLFPCDSSTLPEPGSEGIVVRRVLRNSQDN